MPTALDTNYFTLKVWDTDAKGTLLATVHRFRHVLRSLLLMQPHTSSFTAYLSDKDARTFGNEGTYYEMSYGYTPSGYPNQALFFNGYLQKLTKTPAKDDQYVLEGASTMIHLSGFKASGAMYLDPRRFWNVVEILNGWEDSPGSGTFSPGNYGILSGFGRAVWVDPNFPGGALTALSGGHAQYATTLNVGSTTGFTLNHAAVVNGNDFYHIAGMTGTTITIRPGLRQAYTGSTAVEDAGYALPGNGDYWRTDWASGLLNSTMLCQHYNIYLRERLGSTRQNFVMEIGPLRDPSGLTIWGGTKLANDLFTNHGIQLDPTLPFEPNAAYSQEYGYAQIEQASVVDDYAKIVNLYWGIGYGSPDTTGVTIRTLVGGDPPGNGWSLWQPNTPGKKFYVKNRSRATFQGNVFEWVAWQRQDSKWQYGMVNRGPSPGAGPPQPAGMVIEGDLIEKKILDAHWLDSALAGQLEYNSDKVKHYSFTVMHPMISAQMIPDCPMAGQTIDVEYQGDAESMVIDTNTASATYGQQIGSGLFTYLKMPTQGDPTDETGNTVSSDMLKKITRIIQVDEEFTGLRHQQTITMGRGKWHSKMWADKLAKDMEHHSQKGDQNKKHPATKTRADSITFATPNNQLAGENPATGKFEIASGGMWIADIVADTTFFSDGHIVAFFVDILDARSILRFIVSKHRDALLVGTTSTQPYLVFQLAGSSSGANSGLYTTSDGSTFTQVGNGHRNAVWTNRQVGAHPYLVAMHWLGGVWTVNLGGPDASGLYREQKVWTWQDTGAVIGYFGAIGWYHAGSATQNINIYNLTAEGAHPHKPGKGTVSPHAMAESHESGQYDMMTSVGTNGTVAIATLANIPS